MEGGAPASDTADAATMDNSQNLRQSLNRIFSELLDNEVSIIIQMGTGYRSVAKQFANSEDTNCYLYVDLDNEKTFIPNWFDKLLKENLSKPIVIPEEKQDNVFFMVQEMEAWILKQPLCLDAWAKRNGYKRLDAKPISSHSLIARKNVEEIRKPSVALSLLIKHYFEREHDGKRKKVKYGKLKNAPDILDEINVIELLYQDSELQRFCNKIKE